MNDADIERFWSKVDKTDGCWGWAGGKNAQGYGQFYFRDSWVLAHRASWMIANGPIPKGMFVCHHCDNPQCVRPDHLFAGTNLDNVRDSVRKGRHIFAGRHGSRGESNNAARLTEQIVREIRAAHAGGETQDSICRRLGILPGHMSKIINGSLWRHVKVEPDSAQRPPAESQTKEEA